MPSVVDTCWNGLGDATPLSTSPQSRLILPPSTCCSCDSVTPVASAIISKIRGYHQQPFFETVLKEGLTLRFFSSDFSHPISHRTPHYRVGNRVIGWLVISQNRLNFQMKLYCTIQDNMGGNHCVDLSRHLPSCTPGSCAISRRRRRHPSSHRMARRRRGVAARHLVSGNG
jgi:hypothetical protein